MGLDVQWLVLKRGVKHDATKDLCFAWERQEEDAEVMDKQVVDWVGKDCDVYNVKHSDSHTRKWCPKCKLFYCGPAVEYYNKSPIVLDRIDVHHSCSNPVVYSPWFVVDLWLGSDSTDYARKFRPTECYREVLIDDVEFAEKSIEHLGTPVTESDVEACSETLKVLAFLRKWCSDESAIVVGHGPFY